jgi:hypothetical protein
MAHFRPSSDGKVTARLGRRGWACVDEGANALLHGPHRAAVVLTTGRKGGSGTDPEILCWGRSGREGLPARIVVTMWDWRVVSHNFRVSQ